MNRIDIGFGLVPFGEHDHKIVTMDLKPFHPLACCLDGAHDAFHFS